MSAARLVTFHISGEKSTSNFLTSITVSEMHCPPSPDASNWVVRQRSQRHGGPGGYRRRYVVSELLEHHLDFGNGAFPSGVGADRVVPPDDVVFFQFYDAAFEVS